MSEDLTTFLDEKGLKCRYMHSDIDAIERIEIITSLRKGEFDILIGVNLLREGLDLPEVALVVIFDADKEGFLRNYRSLIQTIGRAARNTSGKAVLFADKMTGSMKAAIEETVRRRTKQEQFNLANNITPKTIYKKVDDILDNETVKQIKPEKGEQPKLKDIPKVIKKLTIDMNNAAEQLEFELAAALRDQIRDLEKIIKSN